MADSNVNEVIAWLTEFVSEFNFTRAGFDQSLGRDIVGIIADGIQARSMQQLKGAEVEWPENSDNPPGKGYASWKKKKYDYTEAIPNVRTNQMLSILSLRGNFTTIEPELITMRYGTGEITSRSDSPNGYLDKQDQKKTDIQKAVYAHTGQSKKKVRRPFYELDDEFVGQVLKMAGELQAEHIREHN